MNFLKCFWIDISVVLLTSRNRFRVIALKSVNVENVAKTATIGSSRALNANIELSAVCWVRVSGVSPGLILFCRVWAYESFGYLQLITPIHAISPNANPLIGIIGESWGTFVLGRLAIPTGVEDVAFA